MSGITVAQVHEGTKGSPTIAGHVTARRGDGATGLIFEDRAWAWSDVVEESAKRAAALSALREVAPFHVGILLENVPEYVFALFGASLCGATVVGINSTRRGEELARDIVHTDCQLVLTDERGSELLDGLDLGPATGRILDVESGDYRTLLEVDTPPPEDVRDPGDLYLLLFTAGSTGAPKAVRMSQARAARTAGDSAMAFGPGDVLYCSMPLFHGNALLANLFPGLITGASVVLRRRFSASSFGPDIRRHGCTYFNYVGRALSYIVAVPETPEDGNNKLKWALGSEASPQNIAEFTRRFKCPVFEGYGSSENAVVITPVPGMPQGAMGRARQGMDVGVVDPSTGGECATARFDADGRLLNAEDAIGEIVGRNTADRFEGYYNNPDAEAERTRGGWYWTGDLGYRDAESFFYFAGRSADWLRVDGENFSAGSVERILNRFPPATGVAVYGVPDPVSGDQLMAALEIPQGARFEAADFAAFLAGQSDLGTKWAPRFIRVVADLPVTGAGKLDKAPLRAVAWNTTDPVWWRPSPDLTYYRFTIVDGEELSGQFRSNGRESFLPRSPV